MEETWKKLVQQSDLLVTALQPIVYMQYMTPASARVGHFEHWD